MVIDEIKRRSFELGLPISTIEKVWNDVLKFLEELKESVKL